MSEILTAGVAQTLPALQRSQPLRLSAVEERR
jgi:hypothetical protein